MRATKNSEINGKNKGMERLRRNLKWQINYKIVLGRHLGRTRSFINQLYGLVFVFSHHPFLHFGPYHSTLYLETSVLLAGVSLLTVPLADYCNGKIVNCLFLKTTINVRLAQCSLSWCFSANGTINGLLDYKLIVQ